MDTENTRTERDRSSEPDRPDPVPAAEPGTAGTTEERARSGRFPGLSRVSGLLGGSWRRSALLAVVCLGAVLLVSRFVVQPFHIPSGSMEPTLRTGDRVLVNKLAYGPDEEPERGDLIVFDGTGSFVREAAESNPVQEAVRGAFAAVGLAEPAETDFVKRVIGVGGDRVVCCDEEGRITVNGVALDERYLHPGDAPSDVAFDIVVRPGTLWVMGDHRSDSRDSRDHLGAPGGGMVPLEKVIGRADWIGWPAGRWGSLERTDAFARVPDAPEGSAPDAPGSWTGGGPGPSGAPAGSGAPFPGGGGAAGGRPHG
ncbi:signal peptidase I [Streptomyces qinzhouensis]|uniref:signal peptidase I n=1 Tax=Streptomyces qinzhouensis TaxID=2599401 RepID=UPI001FEC9358|nr:signal peptidase I [Streptomyces qinzhouensis]